MWLEKRPLADGFPNLREDLEGVGKAGAGPGTALGGDRRATRFLKGERAMTPEQQFELIKSLALLIGGGLIGIAASLVMHWLEAKREQRREAKRLQRKDYQTALEWARKGRKDSLRGAHLKGADLIEVDLAGADLRNADLQRAYLVLTNLREAILVLANLQEAVLVRANLQRAYLGFANLQRAILVDANLQGAWLRGANLQGAWLVGADLRGAILRGANFQEADLREAKLDGAKADQQTIWPEGFEVPEGVVIED